MSKKAPQKFISKLLTYVDVGRDEEGFEENFELYKAENGWEGKGSGSKYFLKYPYGVDDIRVSNLRSETFESWLAVNSLDENLSKSKMNNIIFDLEKIAKYYDSSIPARKLFTRVGYDLDENGCEKIYLCMHNSNREVIEIDLQGWRIIADSQANVLFEDNGFMMPLFTPKHGGTIDEIRNFINVNDEDFRLVIGWLLVALTPNPNIDCPILWLNAPKGTGKTTATKFLKRLIDPDFGGTISPVDTLRDFAASVSSRYIVGIDNVSKITPKMIDVYCRAVTGDTLSVRKMFTDNTVNNVNMRCHLMINGMNYAPPRSDLQDRCFQITLRSLNENSRKSNDELENCFKEREPYILGALLDAVSAGLRNKTYIPQVGVNVRMLDACQLIMRVANTNTLPFSEEEFCQVLSKKKEEAEAADKSQLYENTVLSLIYDMAQEKFQDNRDADEVVVWDDSTGKLLKELQKRASVLEHEGSKGISKDIPSSPQKLGKELSNGEALLKDECIYIDRRDRTRDHRKTKIIYNPSEKSTVPQTPPQAPQSQNEVSADEVISENIKKKGNDSIMNANNNNNAKTLPAPKEVIQNGQEHASIFSVVRPSPESGQQEKEDIQVSGLQNLPATTNATSNATGIKSIAPNSGQPLYTPLTGLTVDQMMHMVLSNVFVPPEIRYNTIIWDHWEDVFSKALYHWKVIRGHPSSVKLTGHVRENSKKHRVVPLCIICSQVKKKRKDLFKVRYFTFGNLIFNHFQKDYYESMYEAITDCESYLKTSRDDRFFPPSWSYKKHMLSLDWNDAIYNKADLMNNYCMLELQKLGVDNKIIQYLIEKESMALIQTANEILTQDIEPNAEELGGLNNEDYPYVDMLSRQEILELHNERSILGTRSMRENKLNALLLKMNKNLDDLFN